MVNNYKAQACSFPLWDGGSPAPSSPLLQTLLQSTGKNNWQITTGWQFDFSSQEGRKWCQFTLGTAGNSIVISKKVWCFFQVFPGNVKVLLSWRVTIFDTVLLFKSCIGLYWENYFDVSEIVCILLAEQHIIYWLYLNKTIKKLWLVQNDQPIIWHLRRVNVENTQHKFWLSFTRRTEFFPTRCLFASRQNSICWF